MAEMYGTRPSELLGVSDPWPAFCVDESLFVKLALHRQNERSDGTRFEPGGYDLPSRDQRMKIPWAGEGPDPLRGTL